MSYGFAFKIDLVITVICVHYQRQELLSSICFLSAVRSEFASLLWATILYTAAVYWTLQTDNKEGFSLQSISATRLVRKASVLLPPWSVVPIHQKAICDAALNPRMSKM